MTSSPPAPPGTNDQLSPIRSSRPSSRPGLSDSTSESVDRLTRVDIDHTAVIAHAKPCLAGIGIHHSAVVADTE